MLNDKRKRNKHTMHFTDEMVNEMRKLYADGVMSQRALADKFRTTQATIMRIVKGKTWTHLPVLKKERPTYKSKRCYGE